MEEQLKLGQFLKLLGFKVLFILALTSYSCNPESTAEYSFENKLEDDIELYLYFHKDAFNKRVKNHYIIERNDVVNFLKLSTKEKGGFGREYFCKQIDSAKIKINGEDRFIAIWRQSQEPEYIKGYEMKWDFICGWSGTIQHGGSHAEYRYILELQDE
ncbi:hypothetical protein CDL62_17090 [Alkalitalea saponilacus]|uniref:hypothetical protein n=1 Tax=Alkalitalea saponilacus TaxID=889453 RepID=UPI000B4A95B3|nr:hypothetical protein [Alkalitalea saponilacus]ASB50726.1 hypothetical protein CDL62_17005 [Alkalitalea saponilacus]ASB50743.1 hypothetical protein CDL62_17090 [Alkalitalea saponilacus]